MEKLLDQYSKIPAGQRYLVMVAAVAVFVAAYYSLFKVGQENELALLTAELSKQQTSQTEKQAFVHNLAESEKRFNDLRKELDRARSILPDTEYTL